MTEAAPAPVPAPATYPGKTLGVVGLILAIFFSLIGLIVSAVARSQSKKAGFKNTPATVGIVIGIVFLVFQIIGGIAVGVGVATAASALTSACQGQESGAVVTSNDGTVTFTCP
jgi:hypothetical protein